MTEDTFGQVLEMRLDEAGSRLRKIFPELKDQHIHYTFLDRCENAYIMADRWFPGEDLPQHIGVHRDYNGGGVHGPLKDSERRPTPKEAGDNERCMPVRVARKVDRVTYILRQFFNGVLEDLDKEMGSPEIWDSPKL